MTPMPHQRLVDCLLSNASQRYFAEANFELPVVDSVEPGPTSPASTLSPSPPSTSTDSRFFRGRSTC